MPMSGNKESLVLALIIIVNFFFGLASTESQNHINLPTLKNQPCIGVRTLVLNDKTRLDPFASNHHCRKVVLSLFYPAGDDLYGPYKAIHDGPNHCASASTRYMPNATATFYDKEFSQYGVPPGSFKRLFTLSKPNAPINHPFPRSFPLLLFSPGYGASRLFYTAIAQEVARKGFIVGLLDHSYDGGIVELPDGEVITGLDLDTIFGFDKILAPRALDVSFVLNELSYASSSHPFPIDTSRVVVFGHSLGGATAAEVMLSDDRVVGGLNFDENFFGQFNSTKKTISRPFLLFRAASRTTEELDHDWDEAWKKFKGWKLDLELANSTHRTFEDLALLAETFGRRAELGKAGDELLGTLPGLKGLEIMSTYVSAFAKFVFTGKEDVILRGNKHSKFPEVKVIRKG